MALFSLTRLSRDFLAIAFTALSFACVSASAQVSPITGDCLGSWRGGGIPGVDTDPQFATEWNHDGDDSTPTWLLVGAEYMTTAGNIDVLAWAAWDGTTWHSILGDIPMFFGIGNLEHVVTYPIAVDQNNGDLWYHNTGRLRHRCATTGEWSSFEHLQSVIVISYAGLSNWGVDSQFVVHNSVPYLLGRIGQDTYGLLRWSGTEWTYITSLPDTQPFGKLNLYSINNHLYLIYSAQRYSTTLPCVWQLVENQWQPVGDGLASTGYVGYLGSFNGELIASGRDNLNQVWKLFRWTGSQWTPISGVFIAHPQFATKSDGLYYLWSFEDIDFAVIKWDGNQIQLVTPGYQVVNSALTSFRDGLAARVSIQTLNNFPYYPIESFCSGLVIWEHGEYSLPGSGFNDKVNTLLVHNNTLYAAGRFARFGETITGAVAQRVGDSWQPVSQQYLRTEVLSLAYWQDTLIAGTARDTLMLVNGSWQSIGTAATKLAVYNDNLYRAYSNKVDKYENGQWTTILTGGGGSILNLRVIDQTLFAIGRFTWANDQPTEGIASWDGTAVHTFDVQRPFNYEGTPLYAVDLTRFQGSYFGAFGNAIYRLDNQTWTKVNGPQFHSYFAGPLLATEDRLYAVNFPRLDSSIGNTSHIAAFDGTTWLPVVGHTSAPDKQRVLDLAFLNGELHVAGSFKTLLDRSNRTLDTTDYAYWAAWTPPAPCDSVDFNNDSSLFDPQDLEAFFSVYSEGPCIPENSPGGCNDIDFNNDCSVFDPCDINSFLVVYSEGPCTHCGT